MYRIRLETRTIKGQIPQRITGNYKLYDPYKIDQERGRFIQEQGVVFEALKGNISPNKCREKRDLLLQSPQCWLKGQ